MFITEIIYPTNLKISFQASWLLFIFYLAFFFHIQAMHFFKMMIPREGPDLGPRATQGPVFKIWCRPNTRKIILKFKRINFIFLSFYSNYLFFSSH